MPKASAKLIHKAMRAAEHPTQHGQGYCVTCERKSSDYCEPDASRRPCKKCGTNTVYGAEQLILECS